MISEKRELTNNLKKELVRLMYIKKSELNSTALDMIIFSFIEKIKKEILEIKLSEQEIKFFKKLKDRIDKTIDICDLYLTNRDINRIDLIIKKME